MLYKFLKLLKSLRGREIILSLSLFSLVLISVILYIGHIINTKTIETPARGGTWREGVIGQPVFINPVVSNNETDHDISKLVFDNLDGLAESIEPNILLKEWTVRLKEGLKWSDGEKITSDDIIFTFDVITNPEARSPFIASFDGARIERISELEVKFTLPSSYVFFEETLKKLTVIPKHIFSNIPPANFNLSSYAREPVGSGPYKFKSYKKEANGFISEYILTINDNYHGNLPYIRNFIFQFYENESRLIQAFNNGNIDGFPIADPSLFNQIAVIKSVYTIPSARYYAVFLNSGLIPQFRELNVRKALSAFVPRNEIVNAIFNGFAKPSFGPISSAPVSELSSDDFLSGLEFSLTVPDIAPLPAVAEQLKAAWETKGAVVHISSLRPADIRESIRNRDYQALLFGNILNVEDDLYSFWHSSKRFHPGLNLSFFNNQEADLLMEEIRSEANSEKRDALLIKLSSIITNNIGAIFTVFPDYLYVAKPRLKGFSAEEAITSSDRLNNVNLWFVNTNRRFK